MFEKKKAKKWIRCNGWSISNTNTCIQQGNGLVGGGKYNYQRGGGGFHNMCKCQNNKLGWQRREHNARASKPQKKHDKWGRGKPETNYTKDKKGFQWCEQQIQRSWIYIICPP